MTSVAPVLDGDAFAKPEEGEEDHDQGRRRGANDRGRGGFGGTSSAGAAAVATTTTTNFPSAPRSANREQPDPTTATDDGTTPLYIACEKGDERVVRKLLAHAATDVNRAKVDTGSTPLYIACRNGHEGVARMLLGHGATDVNRAERSIGATPLFAACHNGQEKLVRTLLLHAATDVNQATTGDGVTPLFMACVKGHEGVVRLLLAHVATDVNQARTDGGTTPLDAALASGNEALISFLGGDLGALVAAEEMVVQQQSDAGGPVLRRLRGVPGGSVSYDFNARTIRFLGFPTVGAPESLAESGILYYEFEIVGGLFEAQMGFATRDFAIGVDERTDEGVGDDAHSWGVDGSRGLLWCDGSHPDHNSTWPCQWSVGDVIGLAHNVDLGKVAVSKNGNWSREDGCGVVLEGDVFKVAVYPAMSASSGTVSHCLSAPFKHGPPEPAVWGPLGTGI